MKTTRLVILCATFGLISFSQISLAQDPSDNAGNYGGGWGDGSNGGTGFGAWAIVATNGSTNGTSFFSGNFIGNPNDAEITSFGTNAFGLYANPNNSPAFVQADRSFTPLGVGKTFSLKWAINWDSGAGGNKGFNLYTGGTNKTQILNVNNGGSEAITLDGTDVGFTVGTTPMTWTFSQISSNTIRVAANDRDGTGNFAANLTVSGPADSFRIYASAMQGGNQRQSYFNDFAVSNTPAGLDTNPPTIALANGVNKVTWVALNGTVNLTTNDVTAADAEGGVSISISPSNVVTTNNNLATVIYTATDAAGYRASVSRVIAVGSAAPGYHNLRFPASLTINTSSSDSAYGEIYLDGATPGAGAASGIQAWIGVNTNNSDPATWTNSVWSEANYIGEEGNNDNYQGVISGTGRAPGTYYYATRFRLGTNPANTSFFYGGIGNDGVGGTWGGTRQVVVSGVTNTITNGNGVLTVEQGRLVTYAVDMSVQRFKGLFNPSNHSLQVRTGMNTPSYAERALTNTTGDLYTGTFAIPGANASTNLFKFYAVGSNGLAWEDGAERQLVLAATNQNAGTNFFSDVSESRKVTFTVDMSEQVTKGNLNLTSDTVSLAVFTAGYSGGVMSRVPGANQFTYDLFLDRALTNLPTNLEYKFLNNNPNAPNFGYEGGFNRVLARSDLISSNLSTTTIPLATFVDVPLPDTSFTGWRGATAATPELLTQYAFGALTPTNAVNRSNLPSGGVIGSNLTITYFVRSKATNPNLVAPQWHTNLSQSNLWTDVSTGNITNVATNTVDGVEVIQRRASVPMDEGRKFLRLKISE